MTRRQHTIEIEDFGSVTFRPFGKLEMQRLRESARRGVVPEMDPADRAALKRMSPAAAYEMCEIALLMGSIESPKMTGDELKAAIAGREHVINEIAEAIRKASWPN